MKKFFIVSEFENQGKRLDKFLIDEIDKDENLKDLFSRNRVQTIIKDNLLLKNNEIFTDASYKVKNNDSFEIIINKTEEIELKKKNIPLNIVYEDEDLLVINKQAGLTTHPGAGNYDNTLVNALLYYCNDNLSKIGGILRPGIIHRLDKDTSGLMIIAKNDFAHNSLKLQLEQRILKRTYNAIIWGNIYPKNGIIQGNIDRSKKNRLKMEIVQNSGKYSKTNYTTLREFNDTASLLECKLDTGRTHQIRIHFSSKKYPLIGDQLYGGNTRIIKGEKNEFKDFIEKFPRQALHSKNIQFIQPNTKKELSFESELPNDIKLLIKNLENI